MMEGDAIFIAISGCQSSILRVSMVREFIPTSNLQHPTSLDVSRSSDA